jgi:2-polyprenyl-3-methyl-5-hydroxy-6-metoxy-1,4-benzoquinol methylase
VRTAESILSLDNSDLFKYTLTGTNVETLEMVKAQFQTQPTSIEYKILDIEQDTGKQAYEDHTYDIVIAANSLYTVQNVDKALANAHNLLKPSGKLCLVEVTHPGLRLGIVLGSLPGYSRYVHKVELV